MNGRVRSTVLAFILLLARPDPCFADDRPDAPTPKPEVLAALADQDPNISASQSGNDQKPTGPPSNPTGKQDENPKRILGIIPNFQTKDDDPLHQKPLTPKEKYA